LQLAGGVAQLGPTAPQEGVDELDQPGMAADRPGNKGSVLLRQGAQGGQAQEQPAQFAAGQRRQLDRDEQPVVAPGPVPARRRAPQRCRSARRGQPADAAGAPAGGRIGAPGPGIQFRFRLPPPHRRVTPGRCYLTRYKSSYDTDTGDAYRPFLTRGPVGTLL